MRGKVFADFTNDRRFRITPAYAGKSISSNGLASEYGDHPRVCGEKIKMDGLVTFTGGSPPRMLGKDFWGIRNG